MVKSLVSGPPQQRAAQANAVMPLADDQPVHVPGHRRLLAPELLVLPQQAQRCDRRAALADHVPFTCNDLLPDFVHTDLAWLPLPNTPGR